MILEDLDDEVLALSVFPWVQSHQPGNSSEQGCTPLRLVTLLRLVPRPWLALHPHDSSPFSRVQLISGFGVSGLGRSEDSVFLPLPNDVPATLHVFVLSACQPAWTRSATY